MKRTTKRSRMAGPPAGRKAAAARPEKIWRGDASGSMAEGEVVTLTVARPVEHGWVLTDGEQDVLLHHRETTRPLARGDQAEVYLYRDQADRWAATMHMPLVRVGGTGWLSVVQAVPRLGVFVHNGVSKDLLVSRDDLPERVADWPKPGDRLWVTVTRDKRGRPLARPLDAEEVLAVSVPAGREMMNRQVTGTVYNVVAYGAFLFTEEQHVVLVHREEMMEPLRLGQTVTCRISYVRDDGRLNGSLRPRKEERYEADAERLLAYLTDRGGAMPYTDDTPADIIRQVFGLSKSAFKRALGKLMKDGLIFQENGWTKKKGAVPKE